MTDQRDGSGSGARQFVVAAPQVTLPKGGGAIRGIGETFTAHPATGTGSVSVPVATSPGRSGFGPRLALTYDSGAGNGPFGFGWSMSGPSVTRKTDKGLPHYLDAVDSDVFVLSGEEDLVPAHRQDHAGDWIAAHPGHTRDLEGDWVRDPAGELVVHEDEIDGYRIRRYRPRVEGAFARIERWTAVGAPGGAPAGPGGVPAGPGGSLVGDVHWRSVSKDNVLTVYGLAPEHRIADPSDPGRVFSWLISETRDDKGEVVLYRYKSEDGTGVDLGKPQERNRGDRDDVRRTANRYLKRVLYGNRRPALDESGGRPHFLDDRVVEGGWMFEAVLDYGDHDPDTPGPRDDEAVDATGALRFPWPLRPDAFSSYRSGFEVRTGRLCRRVLMFHHFPGTEAAGVGVDCLVRSTELVHGGEGDPVATDGPVYAFLRAVTQHGHRRDGTGYARRSMPPVEFTYSVPTIRDIAETVEARSMENLPAGMDGTTYRWTDLHGEGIPGALVEQSGAWFYKRNISPLPEAAPGSAPGFPSGFTSGSAPGSALGSAPADGSGSRAASGDGTAPRVRFAPVEHVGTMPVLPPGSGAEFVDLAGDGLVDVVVTSGSAPGLYEHDEAEGWQPFRPFTSLPSAPLNASNARVVDLDGDGHADVLVTEDTSLVWYRSLAEEGFEAARQLAVAADEEQGPRAVFSDGTHALHLADLSGDGLPDLVRVRNGEVSYWPNLGHGRFGAKVTMENAPWFDHPDAFDQQRVRLADIDGSGTTDLLYLHRDGVRLYFNQSGNAWSSPRALAAFPRIDSATSVATADLLGDGTTCLVWSSPLASDAGRPMRFVNLMGGAKPHLLVGLVNNLGAETRLSYAPSTKFYLQDKHEGRPWIARLAFPVHVVERVETYDHVSRNRFTTRYRYHHGRYDGVEREFCGFGMVEQWDTEELEAVGGAGTGGGATDEAPASYVPPAHTKSWFHTGDRLGRERVSRHHEGEYYREPGLTPAAARELLLDDTPLPPGLADEEERQACHALKGSLLRREIYSDDAVPESTPAELTRARTPYTVTEQNFTVRRLQGRGAHADAVFDVQPRETLTHQYEREAADPRTQHTIALEVDPYGTVLKEATVGYGRRTHLVTVDPDGSVTSVPNPALDALHPADQARQTTSLVTYTERRVTNAIDIAAAWRHPVTCETRTFELTGYAPTGPRGRFLAEDLVERDPDTVGRLRHRYAREVAYEEQPTPEPCRRPIEHVRTHHRSDDLTRILPLGQLEPRATTGERYTLALTPGLLAAVLRRPRPDGSMEELLPDPAGVLAGAAGDGGGYLAGHTLKADGRFPGTDPDDHWWLPSGRSYFSAVPADPSAIELAEAVQHHFVVRRQRDPFGQDTVVDLDGDDLLTVEVRDPFGNRTTVESNDYRVLQPRLVADANRNRTEVAFDALGMVTGTAVMGKAAPAPAEGDTLDGFTADPVPERVEALLTAVDPDAAADLLADATSRVVYDLDRFRRLRRPAVVVTLTRETHHHDPLPPQGLRIQTAYGYSDGFGREIQRKTLAESVPLTDGGPTVSPRWVCSGWVVHNNKGKPVRQYEPFFGATPEFEFGVAVGVSPVLFHDPVGRVVATLHPHHTYEKVVFGPWGRATYDANDTCAPRGAETGDPRTDVDVRGLLARYFAAQSVAVPSEVGSSPAVTSTSVRSPAVASPSVTPPAWETWHAQRIDGALGPYEQTAAVRAAAHADTPTTTHLDALGRPFLTVERNRVVCPGHELDGTQDTVATRTELDIEGNQRLVRDAVTQAGDQLGRVVVRYAHDMLGNRIHQSGMEAGARWTLPDVLGNPVRDWDSRGHTFTTTYDALRRRVARTVRGTVADGAAASDPRTLDHEVRIERIEYGEPAADASPADEARAQRLNLRTRVLRHYDGAGAAVNARLDATGAPLEAYDFKGNALHHTRTLTADYQALPDWAAAPLMAAESFENSVRYDALNRTVQATLPHSDLAAASAPGPGRLHIVQPVFNEAGLLDRVDVWLEHATEPAGLLDPSSEPPSPVGVADIDYDAHGRRIRVAYKNGATTRYRHDPLTFRLVHLVTGRGPSFPEDCDNPDNPQPPAGNCGLQNLHYTYDPAGNVTHIHDDAQQTVFFRNQRVEPSNDYVHDALYRLIQATGREHLGQQADGTRRAPTAPDASNAFHTRLDHPNTQQTMGTYVERYVHDLVGNITRMQHRGSDPAQAGWTRGYTYAETSLLEDGTAGTAAKTGNRLSNTTLNPGGANPPLVEPYAHDRHGNMTRMPHLGGGDPGPNLHWDHTDRLRRSDLGGGGTVFCVYDAEGRRVRKVWEKAPGLIEERIYLGDFEVFRRHRGPIGTDTAVFERETVHTGAESGAGSGAGEERFVLTELRTRDTEGSDPAPPRLIRYQGGNHLGSACVELDERAQIISYEEYAPYGSTTYQAVRSRTEAPKRYRSTGMERDEETGLAQHGARYYACWLGRWTGADPSGLVDGPNLYRYARGNPITLTDRDGHEPAEALTAEVLGQAASALERAAARWGSAALLSGGAGASAAPAAAPAAAAAPAPAAGVLAAAQAVAGLAMALAVRMHMQRAGSIARFGNPYGVPAQGAAFPALTQAQKLVHAPFPIPESAPNRKQGEPRMGRVYVTYTKTNTKTGRVYSGRTSAVIDLNRPWYPQAEAAMKLRDRNHHVDERDEPDGAEFTPARLDKFAVGFAVNYRERYRDLGYLAIRGREQQLMDHHGSERASELGITGFSGGAWSDTDPGPRLTENDERGVRKDNVFGEIFHLAADVEFGELAPFTGTPFQELVKDAVRQR
ncbi:SpvB/TcaC N-terminal domain-containing protein [Streptomyces sp. NBC_00572]|uniref:SpvB/TcaC N-terminal domain-containing protein n=1 Tax=Streptomyces sp. NBC_00572 TaxID=2903664 RepID=UPI002258F68F|nr:SpvB/TcaC N-terminal domain-containing protein [Streptomyces sp. NBC_00572]MCX4985882.1 FG-GAP-like repeat-containing protein [Streptomyces sp. NBC_00572]